MNRSRHNKAGNSNAGNSNAGNSNANMKPAANWIGWLIVLFPTVLLSCFALSQGSPSAQIEGQTQRFLSHLKNEDKANIKETFSNSLAERFTAQEMLGFAKKEKITPLTTWTILNSSHFKGDGVAHVQTSNGLLRLDYISGYGGWKLQNFCQVDRFVEANAQAFIRHLRAGDLDSAQQMTVDAVYPRRKGRQFTAKRLQALHRTLKALPSEQLGQLSLHEHYSYRQSVQTGKANWTVELYHGSYDRSGCQFFIFDIKQAGEQ